MESKLEKPVQPGRLPIAALLFITGVNTLRLSFVLLSPFSWIQGSDGGRSDGDKAIDGGREVKSRRC